MPNLNDIMEMMDALETKAIITIPTFCVAVRNRHSSCRKCADVCLADAFTIEKNELNIDAGAGDTYWRMTDRWGLRGGVPYLGVGSHGSDARRLGRRCGRDDQRG